MMQAEAMDPQHASTSPHLSKRRAASSIDSAAPLSLGAAAQRAAINQAAAAAASERPMATSGARRGGAREGSGRLSMLAFYARFAGLFLVSATTVIWLMTGWPLLAPFHRRRWRIYVDTLQTVWVNAYLWLIPDTVLELHGEFPDASLTPKLVMCNHQTDVDWMYMFMQGTIVDFGTTDRTGAVKIFLKREVRKIPMVGIGCQLLQFIYLDREWSKDQANIERDLDRLCKDRMPLTIFLFPEGNTINTRSVAKCRDFARDQGRPELDLLLSPRARGFDHILKVLMQHSPTGDVDVFDQTMAFEGYSGEVPTWEMGYRRSVDVKIPNIQTMFSGRASKRCCFDSRRFSFRQLREQHTVNGSLEAWLDERWLRKERLLREFVEHQQFDHLGAEPRLLVPVTGSIWRSLMSLAFYVAMWAAVVFSYVKYAQGADSFF